MNDAGVIDRFINMWLFSLPQLMTRIKGKLVSPTFKAEANLEAAKEVPEDVEVEVVDTKVSFHVHHVKCYRGLQYNPRIPAIVRTPLTVSI